MKNFITSFDSSKKLAQILPLSISAITAFGWFGDDNHILEDGQKWIWANTIEPANSMALDDRIRVNCQTPICPAYTVLDMMPFFAEGKNGEYLNDAIRSKLNSGNKLSSFIADPEFYANLILSIHKNI